MGKLAKMKKGMCKGPKKYAGGGKVKKPMGYKCGGKTKGRM